MKLRVFAVILIVALLSSAVWAKGPGYEQKFVMHVAGPVEIDPMKPAVVSPLGLPMPDFLAGALIMKQIKLAAYTDVANGSVKVAVMMAKDLNYDPAFATTFQNFFHFPFDPNGTPLSMFVIKIQDVAIGDAGTYMSSVGPQTSTRTITFLGKVSDVFVPSPFGDLVGRTAAISAEFDKTGDGVTFGFIGGFVAGSHSTWSFTGTGSLTLPPEE
jgi:hypothetical protein